MSPNKNAVLLGTLQCLLLYTLLHHMIRMLKKGVDYPSINHPSLDRDLKGLGQGTYRCSPFPASSSRHWLRGP